MTTRNKLPHARRLIPPISALAAFEAVARRGSFTGAAEELSLTQSAVSRQVSALESLLGVALFERSRRKHVVLTPSGMFYSERVRRLLSDLATSTTETIALSGGGRVLRLGIPPTFGSRWLVPRMPDFFAAHPDITVEFSTRVPGHPNLGLANLDALIDFSSTRGSGAEWEELMALELRPVATPQLARLLRRPAALDLSNIMLLVHTSERATSAEVFNEPRLKVLGRRPMLTFENYTMLFQAAAAGLGIGLAPTELIETELSTKALVSIGDLSIRSRNMGYFVYQREKRSYPPLRLFRDWLVAAVKSSRAKGARQLGQARMTRRRRALRT